MKFGDWFKAGLGIAAGMTSANVIIKALNNACGNYLKSKNTNETKTDSETEESTEEES